MKPPRSLKITDLSLGSGPACSPGDIAICTCVCRRRKGDVVFEFDTATPSTIRVGARDYFAGIEYGLLGMRVGGERSVTVPPNLTYYERKTYPELPSTAILVYQLRLLELSGKWDPDMPSRLKV